MEGAFSSFRIQTAYKDRHIAFHTVITSHNLQDGKSVEIPTFPNLQTFCQTKPNGGQGSTLIRAVQRVVGAEPDGLDGPDTIRRTQIRLGVDPDCWVGAKTVSALQERLNQGRF